MRSDRMDKGFLPTSFAKERFDPVDWVADQFSSTEEMLAFLNWVSEKPWRKRMKVHELVCGWTKHKEAKA